jgi:hypothetical protein
MYRPEVGEQFREAFALLVSSIRKSFKGQGFESENDDGELDDVFYDAAEDLDVR